MMKSPTRRLAQVASAMLIALVLLASPVFARATSLSAGERSEAEIAELVETMLSAGSYMEGEAIVCMLPGDEGLTAQSSGPLEGAELLSEVTARQYAEATGEAILASGEKGELTAQASDEQVQVLLVRSDFLGTGELLAELLADPRVLSAEPNYLMGFAEEGEDVETADEEYEEPNDVPDDLAVVDEETPVDQPVDDEIDIVPADEDFEEPNAAPDDTNDIDEEIVEGPSVDDDVTVPLTAQGNATASPDLTNYQWFSTGIANAIPQYLDGDNPGVNAPNWNESGATNATGVVAIMDSGVDYTHPDLEDIIYRFSPELQAELGCGEFGYAPAREDKTDPMDGYDHGTH